MNSVENIIFKCGIFCIFTLAKVYFHSLKFSTALHPKHNSLHLLIECVGTINCLSNKAGDESNGDHWFWTARTINQY